MDSMTAFADATEQARMLAEGEVKSSDLLDRIRESVPFNRFH